MTSFSVFLNCCKDEIFSVGIMKYSMLSEPPSVVRAGLFLLPPPLPLIGDNDARFSRELSRNPQRRITKNTAGGGEKNRII